MVPSEETRLSNRPCTVESNPPCTVDAETAQGWTALDVAAFLGVFLMCSLCVLCSLRVPYVFPGVDSSRRRCFPW
jgi:hypothetical protein